MARRERASFSLSRVEAYTDGVFAIAATLLVLDLTTRAIGEVHSNAELWAALGGMSENIMAFVVSFLLLSMLWVIHLRQFRSIARADAALLWLNNVRLLFIVLIPFTTSLTEYSQFVAGRVLLPVNFFLAALLGYATWMWAAARGGHLLADGAKPDAHIESVGAMVAVVCGAIAVALSPWIGSWAFLAYVLDAPLSKMLKRRAAAKATSTPAS